MKQRCVIIGGAAIENAAAVKKQLKADDFNVFCDSGLRHMRALGIKPHLIVGDFDSHENPRLSVETIVLPCEKDDTDTVYAVKEAIKRGFTDFLFLGVVGQRLDHTLGNVSILLYLDALGMTGKIVDDYSVMYLVSNKQALIKDDCAYFSLLNISGTAKGVTIEHAKYPLSNAEITPLYQYGVSNEVVKGQTAKVSVKEGNLLLIKVFKRD